MHSCPESAGEPCLQLVCREQPRAEPARISFQDLLALEGARGHQVCAQHLAQHQGAGLLGSNLLRLGRRQPRAPGQERGLKPRGWSFRKRAQSWAQGGGHTLPSVWGLCLSQPGGWGRWGPPAGSRSPHKPLGRRAPGRRGRGLLTSRWGRALSPWVHQWGTTHSLRPLLR